MDKKLIMAINRLEIGETLNVNIKCVEDKDRGCEGCIFLGNCADFDCLRNNVCRKYIIEL